MKSSYSNSDSRNSLYHCDNMQLMKKLQSNSIDLIYLDPPFNSGKNYFETRSNTKGELEQNLCFTDTWGKNSTESVITNLKKYLQQDSHSVRCLQALLGIIQLIPYRTVSIYMSYMVPRLLELKRVLKKTGSIYVHCDQKISHYLKILLDIIFGRSRFKNEIMIKKSKSAKICQHKPKSFGSSMDVILFYSKTKDSFFRRPKISLNKDQLSNRFTKTDKNGKKFEVDRITLSKHMVRKNLIYSYKNYQPSYGWMVSQKKLKELDRKNMLYWSKNGKPYRKQYLQNYKPELMDNLWFEKSFKDRRNLYYPTQKPVKLLEQILFSSCPPKGIMLDPFCGSGTAIMAANSLKIKWIACDSSKIAIKTTLKNLKTECNLNPNLEYHFETFHKSDN